MAVSAKRRQIEADREITRGRPRKLTFRRVRQLLRLMEYDAAPLTLAAQAVGIDPSTASEWKSAYPRFAKLVARARARAGITHVGRVARGKDVKGQDDWKASSFILERLYRQEGFAPPERETPMPTTLINLQLLGVAPEAIRVQEQPKLEG